MKVDATQHAAPQKQPFSAALKQVAPAKSASSERAPPKPSVSAGAAPKRPTQTAQQSPRTASARQQTPSSSRPLTQTRAQANGVAQRGGPIAAQQAQMPTRQLAQARVHVDAEAHRLGNVRSEHSHTAQSMTQVRTERGEQLDDKQHAKLMDVLTQEFSKDAPMPVTPAPRAEGVQASNAQVKVEAPPETKAAQAAALIEKIEHFVRSNRPGLSLTLNNSLGARVELERLGPKELSVKLFGKPGAEAVGRIREELRARGLNVKLTVV